MLVRVSSGLHSRTTHSGHPPDAAHQEAIFPLASAPSLPLLPLLQRATHSWSGTRWPTTTHPSRLCPWRRPARCRRRSTSSWSLAGVSTRRRLVCTTSCSATCAHTSGRRPATRRRQTRTPPRHRRTPCPRRSPCSIGTIDSCCCWTAALPSCRRCSRWPAGCSRRHSASACSTSCDTCTKQPEWSDARRGDASSQPRRLQTWFVSSGC